MTMEPPQYQVDDGKATRQDSLRVARLVNFFCPGMGQILIGRWLAGAIQLALFTLSVAVGVGLGLLYIVRIYANVIHAAQDSRAPLMAPDPRGLYVALAALGFAIVIMLWSVWDLAKEPRRQRPL